MASHAKGVEMLSYPTVPASFQSPPSRLARRTLSPRPMVKVFKPSSTARMEWVRRVISFLTEEYVTMGPAISWGNMLIYIAKFTNEGS